MQTHRTHQATLLSPKKENLFLSTLKKPEQNDKYVFHLSKHKRAHTEIQPKYSSEADKVQVECQNPKFRLQFKKKDSVKVSEFCAQIQNKQNTLRSPEKPMNLRPALKHINTSNYQNKSSVDDKQKSILVQQNKNAKQTHEELRLEVQRLKSENKQLQIQNAKLLQRLNQNQIKLAKRNQQVTNYEERLNKKLQISLKQNSCLKSMVSYLQELRRNQQLQYYNTCKELNYLTMKIRTSFVRNKQYCSIPCCTLPLQNDKLKLINKQLLIKLNELNSKLNNEMFELSPEKQSVCYG